MVPLRRIQVARGAISSQCIPVKGNSKDEQEAMANSRPLSPHLSIWKWRVHMATSIFHRATGAALLFGGLTILTWWLLAAATSAEAYALFLQCATSPLGWLVLVGLSWSFFQHFCSGVRHLLMDTGWGYDLRTTKLSATTVFVAAVVLTLLFWLVVLFMRGVI